MYRERQHIYICDLYTLYDLIESLILEFTHIFSKYIYIIYQIRKYV